MGTKLSMLPAMNDPVSETMKVAILASSLSDLPENAATAPLINTMKGGNAS